MTEQPKMKAAPDAKLSDYLEMQKQVMGHLDPKHTGVNAFGNVVNTRPGDLHMNTGTEPEVLDNDSALYKAEKKKNAELVKTNEDIKMGLKKSYEDYSNLKILLEATELTNRNLEAENDKLRAEIDELKKPKLVPIAEVTNTTVDEAPAPVTAPVPTFVKPAMSNVPNDIRTDANDTTTVN